MTFPDSIARTYGLPFQTTLSNSVVTCMEMENKSCAVVSLVSGDNEIDESIITQSELTDTIKSYFLNLVQDWHTERGPTSSPVAMINCPSYKKIIAMGDTVVPFIIDDLRNNASNPDFWFTALQEITGVDPIPLEDHGDMKAMAQVWINWGERNGWLG